MPPSLSRNIYSSSLIPIRYAVYQKNSKAGPGNYSLAPLANDLVTLPALGNLRDVPCQPRFIPRGCVPMDKPLVYGLIDEGYSRTERPFAAGLVAMRYCNAQGLDLRAELTAVASVN